MNSSLNKYDALENLIFNEGLKIKSVKFNSTFDRMFIHLNSNLVFNIPISLYARLKKSNKENLTNFKLIAGGSGIHWPELDEDLSLKGFIQTYLQLQLHSEKELVFL